MFHNVPEPEADSLADKVAADIKIVTDITKSEFKLNIRATRVIRIGKRQPDKPRLLLITLQHEEMKRDVLKCAKDLRGSKDWGKIYFYPDLTPKERQAGKELRDELKRRRDQGETNIIIRGGRIVKVTPRRQPSQQQLERQPSQQQPDSNPQPQPENQPLIIAVTQTQPQSSASAEGTTQA